MHGKSEIPKVHLSLVVICFPNTTYMLSELKTSFIIINVTSKTSGKEVSWGMLVLPQILLVNHTIETKQHFLHQTFSFLGMSRAATCKVCSFTSSGTFYLQIQWIYLIVLSGWTGTVIQLQWQTSEFSETRELVQSRVWKMADLERTEQNRIE